MSFRPCRSQHRKRLLRLRRSGFSVLHRWKQQLIALQVEIDSHVDKAFLFAVCPIAGALRHVQPFTLLKDKACSVIHRINSMSFDHIDDAMMSAGKDVFLTVPAGRRYEAVTQDNVGHDGYLHIHHLVSIITLFF